MRHTTVLLLACGLAAMTGCESPGRSLSPKAVARIHDGQTTRAEVHQIFGEPEQQSNAPDGRTLYLYRRFYGPDVASAYAFSPPRSDESHLLVLTLLFNGDGVVEKHLYSHTHPDVNLRQLRAGRELKPDAVAAIRPGVTSREELTQRFGAPDGEELTLTGHRLVYWLYVSGFALTGVTDAQALEVVLDDVGKVLASRVTRRQTGLD